MAQSLDSNEESSPTSADINERFVKVSVVDTGIGINPENQERIFDKFTQIASVFNEKQPGTGLGLSLCKQLIELQRGEIWVESKGEGQGSAFHFIIPARCDNSCL
jgi:signal transduction histidine kinase